jgi:hypothetical protein
MPIVIKELFPSDPISEAVEKVNFNFDQLLLAGGGPPGPIGPAGPPGPIGPQGTRGDHWFTGATYGGLTADHDGVSPLQIQDNFLDPNGDVWNYFDILGSTGWTFSGINLRGPGGSAGATGGSLEWSLYLGASGNAISAPNTHWGPVPGPTTIDNSNLNFIAPLGATKNGLLLGDPDWFYNNVSNWNNIIQFSGSSTGPYQEGTPRLTVIQREVDYFGVNGIQIGAYGLTGATYSSNAPLLSLLPVPSGATVNAKDFFSIGIAAQGSYPREITPQIGVSYYSHSASIKTITRDISIESGEPSLDPSGFNSSIRMKSNAFTMQSHLGDRWISSGVRQNSFLPTWGALSTNTIEINAVNGSTGGSYISMQGSPGAAQGPVIIGKYNDISLMAFWNGGTATPLQISKTNTWGNNFGAAIVFHSETTGNSNDIDAKFINVGNDPSGSLPSKGFQIATPYLSIIDITGPTTSTNQRPRFPFHVNRVGANFINFVVDNISTFGYGAPNSWSNSTTYPGNSSGFVGWISGFDKNNLFTFGAPAKGIGIGYSRVYGGTGSTGGNTDAYSSFELNLQTYWTAAPGPLFNNFFTAGNNQAVTGLTGPTEAGGFMTGTIRTNPHVWMQIGDENASGNIGIGLGPSGGTAPSAGGITDGRTAVRQIRSAFSKLSVGGSIRVGDASSGIHVINVDNSWFRGGALIGGKIVRGLTAGSSRETFESTSMVSNSTFRSLLSVGTGTDPGPTSFGISSLGRTLSDTFVARQKGNTGPMKEPAFSLPDLGTGIGIGATSEGYLLTNSSLTAATTTSSDIVARFTKRGDIAGGSLVGLQTMGVYAEDPIYMDTRDLMLTGQARIGSIGGSIPRSWRYFRHEIPTSRSIIFLDLSLPSPILVRWASTSYGSPVAESISSSSYLNTFFNQSVAPDSLSGWTGRRYFLERGQYDGQHVTIIFGPVHPNNEFSIFQGGELPSFSYASGPQSFPDRHILASHFNQDIPRGATNYLLGPFIGQAWPFPIGASVVNVPVSGGAGTVNNVINNNSTTAFNNIAEQYALGSSPSTINYYRFSSFTARPWRSISFRWLKVRDTFTDNNNYAWVEIGREYLGPQDLGGPTQTTIFTVGAAVPSPPTGSLSVPSGPTELP